MSERIIATETNFIIEETIHASIDTIKIIYRGSGNPADQHDIIGLVIIESNGNEKTIGNVENL